eukprot:121628_1
MALMKSKLNTVPQRNKAVAFGFCREEEIKWNDSSNIPQLIKYLCLLYLNQNKDEFDINNCHKDLKINDNYIKSDGYGRSCFLKNIVKKGKYIWRFQLNEFEGVVCYDCLIGIYNTEFETTDYSYGFDDYFDNITFNNEISTGYGLRLDGRLTNPENSTIWGKKTELKCQPGDIIEMILDFNNLTLCFKINNKQCTVKIENGEYKAALTLCSGSFTLLSYQELY